MTRTTPLPVSGRGTFKKASNVIVAGGKLDLVELRLFDYLLQRAYKNLNTSKIHTIPVKDALDAMHHGSTARLHESLELLGKISVGIDYVDHMDVPHKARVSFLTYDLSKAENGVLKYAFDPLLLEFLYEPKVYAYLDAVRLDMFGTKYGNILYQVMKLHWRMYNPVWVVSLDELREFFGLTPGQYTRFDNFRRKVLESAIEEVNEFAEFLVEAEYLRGGIGGKINAVCLRASSKSHQRLIEARQMRDPVGRGKRVDRDPDTIDFLDGQTDTERGASAALQSQTLADAGEMLQGGDIEEFVLNWREEMRGRVVRDPDKSFLNWLSLKVKREEDSVLSDLDDDTFGLLVEQMEQAS